MIKRLTHITILKLFGALLLCIAFGLSLNTAMSDDAMMDEGEALAFIAMLSEKAEPLLDPAGLDLATRRGLLADLLYEHFALDALARFSLGMHWRRIDDDEKSQYLKLFRQYVTLSNASRMESFNGAKVTIIGADAGKRDQMVTTNWLQNGYEEAVIVKWRVRPQDGQPKILDVIIAGVSMAQIQRDEFQSIINRDGMKGLNEMLERKIDELKAANTPS